MNARSGVPINVTINRPDTLTLNGVTVTNVPGGNTRGTLRPDLVPGVDPYLKNGVRWLNPAGFAAAPEGRAGNSERGGFTGPSLTVFDLSLRKGFAVGRGVNVQVQADLFNALNKSNLRYANQTLVFTTSGAFAQLDQAAAPRQIQLAARFIF